MKRTLKIALRIALLAVVVFFTVILVRAFDKRKLPRLEVWHTTRLTEEFRAADCGSDYTFSDYLKGEEELFEELEYKVYDKTGVSDKQTFNRYDRKSPSWPGNFKRDYNRSYELVPEEIVGGVLLVHGLTDSPYSMRTIADFFYDKGFYVLSLRVPGHGTIPGALTDITWRDWTAAVKLAAVHVRQRTGADRPFYMAGYSNGAPLILLYTLKSLQDESLASPDRMFMFSPAIGVTKLAALSEWMTALSFIPYFEKSKWQSITPEYDPFKYNSFPLNASRQIFRLTRKTQKMLVECEKDGTLSQLPGVTTFQSVVDSTVITRAITNKLYSKLTPGGHELVLFDVNRDSWLHNFLKSQHDTLLQDLIKSDQLPYRLTIITNEDPDSSQVVARMREHGSGDFREEDLGMEWPRQVYSLSHLAIVTGADDTLYGLEPGEEGELHLGNIELRGERDLLVISAKNLMRLRSNPFFDYITERMGVLISRQD